MKKLSFFMLYLLLIGSSGVRGQSERNCYNTQFVNDAPTLNLRNAYLLSYLTTMCYVDYLRYLYSPVPSATTSSFIKQIRDDDDKFLVEFESKLRPLFTPAPSNFTATPAVNTEKVPAIINNDINPTIKTLAAGEPAVTFRFIHKCNPAGYDPEAIVVSTPSTVFVIFRGTDRVGCNTSKAGYTWAEWMASDFKFLKRDAAVMNIQIQGQVHRGMVESLMAQNPGDQQNFADELGTTVAALVKNKTTGDTKKVWITGHSLGGAHAQLFAMFLKFNYSIQAQGLYTYEAPHPGDAKFVAQLNSVIGKNRIQRFEFGDDPIPTLPPQAFFYGRAGVRNYFKDYNSPATQAEQIAAIDDARILCALGNLPAEQVPQFASFTFPPYCPGSTCYHHPTFILKAIAHSMNSSTLANLPDLVPLPLPGDNCNAGNLTKAENNDLINNTFTAIETNVGNAVDAASNAIQQIAWSATNIVDNLLGTGIAEGKYKLACYAFKNNSKKYLNWNNTVNSQVSISTSGSTFNLVHKLTGGYQLYIGEGNLAANVVFNALGVPTGEEKNNNVIMRPKDIVIGDEETWYLFKVPNTTSTFVLYNWNSRKVLDAPDECLSASGNCPVNEFNPASNNATQVWILEKVN
jgi:hypothetical protein